MMDQFDAVERQDVPPMRLLIRRAMRQAKLDETIQQQAMDRARYEGDSDGRTNFRNARDRNRLAIRWIRARIAKEG